MNWQKFKLIAKLTPPKGHVEIGFLTTFGALKLNRYQVMTLETWLKIYTNVCNFVTTSPQTILTLKNIFQFLNLGDERAYHELLQGLLDMQISRSLTRRRRTSGRV